MKMNIAVCEDIASDCDLLCAYIQDYCNKHCYEASISSFETAEALLDAFSESGFDLVFLDIILPGISGVDAAAEIRKTDRDCMLMFITVSRDHAVDGFDLQASGYVVKPYDRAKLYNALHV